MKILLINGSPKGKSSNTLRVTNAFIKGLGQNEIETIAVKDLNFSSCKGCMSCWGKTAGECVIKDDMQSVYEKIDRSDLVIESFPLYFFGLPGQLKCFTDRMMPLMATYRGTRPDLSKPFHEPRESKLLNKKFVLISSCGYISPDYIYKAIKEEFNCIAGKGNYTLLTCPQSEMLKVPSFAALVEKYLQKYTDAGKEFIKDGRISDNTLKSLSEPLLSDRAFQAVINANWDSYKN